MVLVLDIGIVVFVCDDGAGGNVMMVLVMACGNGAWRANPGVEQQHVTRARRNTQLAFLTRLSFAVHDAMPLTTSFVVVLLDLCGVWMTYNLYEVDMDFKDDQTFPALHSGL